MEQSDQEFEIANGTIRRIAANNVVYVELDSLGERSLSFTPRVIAGYRGQPLYEFGVRLGELVKVVFDPSSGHVQSAQLMPHHSKGLSLKYNHSKG